MNNVVGPYSQTDFKVMQMLKPSIQYMKQAGGYDEAISWEMDAWKKYLNRKHVA